jgi:C-terminal peptidase prc
MTKFLFIAAIAVTSLFAEDVSVNITKQLKDFYDADKAKEIVKIIKESSNDKCTDNENKELICTMPPEELKKIIDQDRIVGVSIIKNPLVNGKFGGLGLTIGEQGQKRFQILKVYRESPAEGKLQKDDAILAIDGVETGTLTLDELVQKLRGKPNTAVTLKIQRDKEILTKTLTRNIVKISDEEMVVAKDDEHLHLSFENGFDRKFSDKIAKLIFQKSYKKLTLDMRRSYGGNFNEILSSLGLFLPQNKALFYTMQGGSKEVHSTPNISQPKRFTQDVEIIIDDSTYSGSLLFVYALKQYYPRCKIIGEKSGTFAYLYAIGELPATTQTKEENVVYLLKYAIGEFYTLDGKVLSGKKLFDVIKAK